MRWFKRPTYGAGIIYHGRQSLESLTYVAFVGAGGPLTQWVAGKLLDGKSVGDRGDTMQSGSGAYPFGELPWAGTA